MKKPSKPYKDFPLYAHGNGQWAKRINGRLHYFGKWEAGWEAALKTYTEQRDALYAGANPETFYASGCTVSDLCNHFLAAKDQLLKAGSLASSTYAGYKATCETILKVMSRTRSVSTLSPVDFDNLRAKLAKRCGVVTLANEINRVRIVFRYAYAADLVDRPVRFGPHFRRPSKRHLRIAKAQFPEKLFSGDEVRKLIDAAEGQLRPMVLLGINCGLGNADCGRLEWASLDLANGWLTYPRPKTGVPRRAKLWPETVEALSSVKRRHEKLVFITKYGHSWFQAERDNPVAKEFRKLVDTLAIHKEGRGFYSLRHTFATVASGCLDQVAVDHVMGHEPTHIGANYRHGVSDDRLESVAAHVLAWLPPEAGSEASQQASDAEIPILKFRRKL